MVDRGTSPDQGRWSPNRVRRALSPRHTRPRSPVGTLDSLHGPADSPMIESMILRAFAVWLVARCSWLTHLPARAIRQLEGCLRRQRLRLRRRLGSEADLTDECLAFLEGDYAFYLERRGDNVPAWAWMNTLAHSSVHGVRRMARVTRTPASSFEHARSKKALGGLARELLTLTGSDPDRLAALQQELLIPLELTVLRDGARGHLMSDELIALVQEALHVAR